MRVSWEGPVGLWRCEDFWNMSETLMMSGFVPESK
jgi:hypothetical protein